MSDIFQIDRLIYLVASAYLKTYQQIFEQSFSGIKGKFLLSTMDTVKKQMMAVGDGTEQ